jgi:hypothetical protein
MRPLQDELRPQRRVRKARQPPGCFARVEMQQLSIGLAPGDFEGQVIDGDLLRASLDLQRTVSGWRRRRRRPGIPFTAPTSSLAVPAGWLALVAFYPALPAKVSLGYRNLPWYAARWRTCKSNSRCAPWACSSSCPFSSSLRLVYFPCRSWRCCASLLLVTRALCGRNSESVTEISRRPSWLLGAGFSY